MPIVVGECLEDNFKDYDISAMYCHGIKIFQNWYSTVYAGSSQNTRSQVKFSNRLGLSAHKVLNFYCETGGYVSDFVSCHIFRIIIQ